MSAQMNIRRKYKVMKNMQHKKFCSSLHFIAKGPKIFQAYMNA
jgi:hypothetical protein